MQRWQNSLMHINGSPLGKNVFTATDSILNPFLHFETKNIHTTVNKISIIL